MLKKQVVPNCQVRESQQELSGKAASELMRSEGGAALKGRVIFAALKAYGEKKEEEKAVKWNQTEVV